MRPMAAADPAGTAVAPDPGAFRDDPGPTPAELDRLAAHLAAHGLGLDRDAPVRRFAGGLANQNFLLSLDTGPVVLRRPPGGDLPPGAHDMAREHRILSRLWTALPFVPRGRHLCEDRAVLGVPFQLIDYRPGLTLRGDGIGPLAGRAGAPEALSRMLVGVMAAIHRVDADAVGLGDLGRPEGFAARAVAGWTRRAEAAAGDDAAARAAVAEIGAWMGRQPVTPRPPALLHGDVKLDNCILDPDTLAPVAVVDWDMGTRGDPLFDLGTLLGYWAEPGDPDCMQRLRQMPTAAVPGFPTRARVVAAYAEATGLPVDDIALFRVLGLLKLAVIFLQLHERWRTGAVADPGYAAYRPLGLEILDFARQTAAGRAAP